MQALKLIYSMLLAGESFGKIDEFRLGGTYFWDVLSADETYIYWRHYGSSANKTSLTNLKWIMTNIFKMTPEQFLVNYTTYSEWKRIDKCYGDERRALIR